MRGFFVGLGICICVLMLGVGCWVLDTASWFVGRSVDVAKQQLDPAELLRKYELFKDESASLDAKLASIHSKQKAIDRVRAMPMDRTNREQLMVWEQEFEGMKYSYNQLASDYNAQMAKINYRFCNVGELPQGATTALPREYKPYLED